MTTDPSAVILGRYEVLEELASTPFERNLRARDRVLEREVVLKLPGLAVVDGWTVDVKQRLLREARALASVRHAGIVAILDVLEAGGGPILVLDPLEGEVLADRLRSGPLDLATTRTIGIDVAEALAALHYEGYVHRAVGPEAVRLRTDGHAVLVAFTFAKEFSAQGTSSIHYGKDRLEAGRHLPPYPAPEQLVGKPAEPRTDVFALGCLLWRCLVGTDPIDVASNGPGNLRRERADVPAAFAEIVRCCMAPASAARYATARAVADALRAMSTAPTRRRLLAPALGAMVALAAMLALWSSRPPGGDRPESGRRQRPEAVATVGAHGDTYMNCHALLIGIDDYSGGWAKLPNAIRDIDAVQERLIANDPRWSAGLRRISPGEATRRRIHDELARLRDLSVVSSEDAVLVWFAGHGCCVDPSSQQYWLVAADAQTTDPHQDPHGFVPRLEIDDLMANCPAKHVLVVLDTCFAARVFGSSRGEPLIGKRRPTDGRRDPLLRQRARDTLVSAGADRTASDGGDGMSPFCRAFIAAITPSGPEPTSVSVAEVHARIQAAMRRQGDGSQLPILRSQHDGNFVFFAGASTQVR